jgi:hypothetical protein
MSAQQWHEVELLCPAWIPTALTATAETFDERDDAFITGEGVFVLSCGHTVAANDYRARLGNQVPGPLTGSHPEP